MMLVQTIEVDWEEMVLDDEGEQSGKRVAVTIVLSSIDNYHVKQQSCGVQRETAIHYHSEHS